MNYQDLLLKKKDGIATLIMNAPEKMNALTFEMQKSLPLAVDELARDDEVKVVIVTGAGERAFSAGGDVTMMRAMFEGTFEASRSRYYRMWLAGQGWGGDIFPRLDKPVIAAINGACTGAGFSIALSCDIRIASETARFGSLFIGRGLIRDCALTYLLPHIVGTSKALELMFTGEIIDATEAKSQGLVSRVVPTSELLKVAEELAVRIIQQPAVAIEFTKRLVYRNIIDDIRRHLEWESYAQLLCFETEDHKESVRAFLEKRPQPKFKGR